MKKEDIDLRALENADEETIKRLSALPCPVSEKDRDRLFEKCEKRTAGGGITRTDNANVVTGVETYRRPVWRSALAIASAFVLIAGVCTGGVLLKGFRGGSIVDPTAATDGTAYTSDEEQASAAPFGDISGGRVRFMSTAYAPYVYDTFSDATAPELAEAFNSSWWEELPEDSQMPDGERTFVYVDNNGQRFSLAFCGGTVSYEKDGSITNYSVSEDVTALVRGLANPKEPDDALQGHLIWCKSEDLNADGVWKNNEPVPETIFEQASVPSGLKGMNIKESYPQYDYAYDIHDINENAKHADDLITGKVEEVSYGATAWVQEDGPSDATPFTKITVTVTGDTAGRYAPGDTVDIETAGGFVSLRGRMGDQLYMTGGKYGSGLAMTEEEIDNTYYHEIVESGEVPIVGKEYAFFVADDTLGGLTSVGFEYGMLYKCDNIYIQRVVDSNSGNRYFNFFDMNDLRAMMRLSAEPDETAADNDDDWGISMELSNVNPKRAELTITRSSDGKLKGTPQTGMGFHIEQLTDDGWKILISKGSSIFSDDSIFIPTEGEPVVMTLDWENRYGELTPGKYRIVKTVTDYRAPSIYDEKEYYLPFEIRYAPEDTSATDIVPAEESDKYGVSMAITNVTPRGARLTVFRDSSGSEADVNTRGDYWIERQTEDGWEAMTGSDKIIFPADTYDIPVGGRLSLDVTWYWIFGDLEPGNYRLVKYVYENDSRTRSEQHIIPFTVEEGAEADDTTVSTEKNVILIPVGYDFRDTKLISAIGDNGKLGYIYESEMHGHQGVTNPQEAMAYMESIKNGTYKPKAINVYEQDGVTVIDTMTEQLN